MSPVLPKNTKEDNLRKSGVINRLPEWFRQDIIDNSASEKIKSLSGFNINTVCQEARCPNLSRCFKNGQLTFMILGDTCTRACLFCAVKKSQGKPLPLDRDEPYRVAESARRLGLKYAVITSVTRDDLEDGGAGIFVKAIQLIRAIDRNIGIEVLIPDFRGKVDSLRKVTAAAPSVLAHNIETIQRLYPALRPGADYRRSLGLLGKVKEISPQLITKSSLMLGLGEGEDEVIECLRDLRSNKVDIVTLGQYLAPSANHYPVKEFISLEQFERYCRMSLELGFKSVASGPLVRSSYNAKYIYEDTLCMT